MWVHLVFADWCLPKNGFWFSFCMSFLSSLLSCSMSWECGFGISEDILFGLHLLEGAVPVHTWWAARRLWIPKFVFCPAVPVVRGVCHKSQLLKDFFVLTLGACWCRKNPIPVLLPQWHRWTGLWLQHLAFVRDQKHHPYYLYNKGLCFLRLWVRALWIMGAASSMPSKDAPSTLSLSLESSLWVFP